VTDPRPGQLVGVEVPGHGRVEARVDQAADGRLILSTGFAQLALDGEDLAVLEFTTPRGLCRLEGFVRETGGDDANVLDFRQLLEPALEQRRGAARADAVIAISAWIEADQVVLYALNVSAGGMLLSGADRLAVDDVFWFEIDIDDQAPLTGRARVVREDEGGLRAVTLVDVPERGRDRIVRFVFDRHRRERVAERW
jgi:hypothetical protein